MANGYRQQGELVLEVSCKHCPYVLFRLSSEMILSETTENKETTKWSLEWKRRSWTVTRNRKRRVQTLLANTTLEELQLIIWSIIRQSWCNWLYRFPLSPHWLIPDGVFISVQEYSIFPNSENLGIYLQVNLSWDVSIKLKSFSSIISEKHSRL